MRLTYVKVGFAGYGPDLEPEDTGAETVEQLCDMIREELDGIADSAYDAAESYAIDGDYQRAWNTRKLCDTFDNLRRDLDYAQRAQAPLYRDDTAALDQSLTRTIGELFPRDIDVDGHQRLYVWEAEEYQTEHVWQYGRMTGTKTCSLCGLLPLDEDDAESPCPGTRDR